MPRQVVPPQPGRADGPGAAERLVELATPVMRATPVASVVRAQGAQATEVVKETRMLAEHPEMPEAKAANRTPARRTAAANRELAGAGELVVARSRTLERVARA